LAGSGFIDEDLLFEGEAWDVIDGVFEASNIGDLGRAFFYPQIPSTTAQDRFADCRGFDIKQSKTD
jgi:hypothetical protein